MYAQALAASAGHACVPTASLLGCIDEDRDWAVIATACVVEEPRRGSQWCHQQHCHHPVFDMLKCALHSNVWLACVSGISSMIAWSVSNSQLAILMGSWVL
jgi:hypothetical protein